MALDKVVSIWEKMNLELDFTPYIRINSRWVIGLNVNSKIIRLLTKENDHGVGKIS